MYSDGTTDDSGWNSMHQTKDKIRIGENAEVTQNDPDFENKDEVDDEENIELPHHPIIALNFAKKDACICQRNNLLKGHKNSRPRSSFSTIDVNCPKKQIILNCCDEVDLQTLKRVHKLYTDPRGININ